MFKPFLFFTLVSVAACNQSTKHVKQVESFPMAHNLTTPVELYEYEDAIDSLTMPPPPKPRLNDSLVKAIMALAIDGKLVVYNEYTDSIPLAKEEVSKRLAPIVDTVELIPPGGVTPEKKIMVTSRIDNMSHIQFIEDLYYNKQTSAIEKKVIAYSISRSYYDEKGNYKLKNYFWVKNK